MNEPFIKQILSKQPFLTAPLFSLSASKNEVNNLALSRTLDLILDKHASRYSEVFYETLCAELYQIQSVRLSSSQLSSLSLTICSYVQSLFS